jgi:hypothetical protein
MPDSTPAVLIALVVLSSACSPPAAQSPGRREPPARQDLLAPGCAGPLRSPAGPGGVRGDVDGDGRSDRVYVVVDRSAESGCRALLVVRSRGRLSATSLDDSLISFELGFPRLNSLADIDSEPGLEMVVDVAQGASTSFVEVLTFSEGRPAPVRPAPLSGIPAGLFAHGGSVGHLDAVDCRRGLVMVSSAVARSRGYLVTRRFMEPQGRRWSLRPSLTQRNTIRPQQIGRFGEFSAPPFANC